MAHPPAQQLATHLLNQTLSSISILESLSVINSSDAHLIRSKLPSPTGPFPSLNPPPDISTTFGNLNVAAGPSSPYHQTQNIPPQSSPSYQYQPTPPPALPPRARGEVRAKALWDYNGAEADDLTFRSGDTLVIDEEVNDQWYRGRVIPQGQNYPLDRSGLFPSNYIEKLSQGAPGQNQSPPYYGQQQPQQQGPPSQMVPYQPPGPPQPYGGYNDNKPLYGAPPQHMQMIPQQPPQQNTIVVQQEEQKKSKFGKLGGTLGNAAVHGAGFGFGSAVASEMVHKIF